MTRPRFTSLYIRDAPNPRSDNNPVRFHIQYNQNQGSGPDIQLRIELPTGADDYYVPITWAQWELMDTWLHSQLLDES